MNTPEQNVDHTDEHEGLIKTPKQLIVVIVLAFVIPITVILLLIRLVTASTPLGVGSDAQSQEAVALRIQPVAGFALVTAEGESEERTGEQIYAATCAACHGTGVAGAPTLGDTAAWAPLLEKGYETLLQNAINGINAMPPRGGNPNLSDLEVARAVVHMANQSGGDLPEPQAAEGGAEGDAQAASDGAGESAEAAASAQDTEAAVQAATAANEAQQEAQAQAGDGAPAQQGAGEGDAAAAQPADAAETAEAQQDAVEEQQQEIGDAAAAADVDLAAGEKLYNAACFACHGAGVAGAPKLGDRAAWEPLMAAGMDQMIQIAIEGKGLMPPRGGTTASDEEIAAAVHYMVNTVK